MVLRTRLLEGGCAEFKFSIPLANNKTSQSLTSFPRETGLIIAATPFHAPELELRQRTPEDFAQT